MAYQWISFSFEDIRVSLQYRRIRLRILCLHLLNQIHLLRDLILNLNLHFGSLRVLPRHQNLILNLPFIHHHSPYLIITCLPILQDLNLSHRLSLHLPNRSQQVPNFLLLIRHHLEFPTLQFPID